MKEVRKQVLHNWDAIAKPIDGLGSFETLTAQIGAITGEEKIDISKKAVLILCADNGIVEENISQSGQEVTVAVARSIAGRHSSVCQMAEVAGADIIPVDIGIQNREEIHGVLNKKIRCGTRNFLKEPAMTEEETVRAMAVGMELVRTLKEEGYRILATGEMGIGNTTTSSAVVSVLLDESVENVTGRGAGLSSEGLNRKIRAIERAIEKHQPDKEDVLDVLSKVGGLDIAGMTGAFLGGAIYHIPVLIDGFISSAAALCAVRMVPETADYILASHCSGEPAGRMVLEELKLPYLIDAKMSLGEGSGAVAAIPLLEMGVNVYRKMSTFEEIKVEQYEELK